MYIVNKQHKHGGEIRGLGEIVKGSEYRVLQLMLQQRYLNPLGAGTQITECSCGRKFITDVVWGAHVRKYPQHKKVVQNGQQTDKGKG